MGAWGDSFPVAAALMWIQKALIREKGFVVLFLIIKQVMGSILAEGDLTFAGAYCASSIANA